MFSGTQEDPESSKISDARKLTDRLLDKNALKEDVAESGEASQPAAAFEPLCLCLLREEAKGFSVDLQERVEQNEGFLSQHDNNPSPNKSQSKQASNPLTKGNSACAELGSSIKSMRHPYRPLIRLLRRWGRESLFNAPIGQPVYNE